MREGLASAEWPGRLEEVGAHPTLVLDGAHNPAGIEALARALPGLYPGRALHLVFGVLADKDHRPMIRTLFPLCQSVHLCPLPSPRSLSPDRYLDEARALAPRAVAYPTLEEALAGALAAAGRNDVVVCAGSLFLVGAVKAARKDQVG
jgi:dihydrofolate synthase/folylpolyglutamate synthase